MHSRFLGLLVLLLGFAGAAGAKPVLPAGRSATALLRVGPGAPTATLPATGATVVYSSVPDPLPDNVASVGFQATSTSEFGDLIRLAPGGRVVETVTVTLSSGTAHSSFPSAPAAGYSHPLTVNIYAVDRTTGTPQTGLRLASVTQTFLIPWRAESGSPPGVAFNATFALGTLALSLPDEVIVAIAFNTQHYGVAPLGVAGPYESLNVGVSDLPPEIGEDVEADALFWQTAVAGFYSDGGAAGVNTLRRDTGWAPYRPALRVTTAAASSYADLGGTAATLASVPTATARETQSLVEARALVAVALNRVWWADGNRLELARGDAVFTCLAEAADDLSAIETAAAGTAARALYQTSEQLLLTAVREARTAGANPKRLAAAEAGVDDARASLARGRVGKAIDACGKAWRTLQKN